MRKFVRGQLTFYGSNRTYKPTLEMHGFGDLSTRLHELLAKGDQAGLLAAVPDE